MSKNALVLVCLFSLTDLDLVRILMPDQSLLRSAAFFNFFPEREVLNLTLAILHSHLGCNFQYSVCFLFSVTDLDGVGELSILVPFLSLLRAAAFFNPRRTIEILHFQIETEQWKMCILNWKRNKRIFAFLNPIHLVET